ncbi:hypothetical protein BDR05DRAFT_749581 [Suillus weaverae]|nr:hypothetical protein BDR05DRAFT_730697 [Suillus weaverae]KAG2346779.1 hypothetical protein BDR05DRAFT_749581 [Suillus weaverae]
MYVHTDKHFSRMFCTQSCMSTPVPDSLLVCTCRHSFSVLGATRSCMPVFIFTWPHNHLRTCVQIQVCFFLSIYAHYLQLFLHVFRCYHARPFTPEFRLMMFSRVCVN